MGLVDQPAEMDPGRCVFLTATEYAEVTAGVE